MGCLRPDARQVLVAKNKFDVQALIAVARGFSDRVVQCAQACGYEEMGIFNSEMLFLCASLNQYKPRRILESGRARGQSTAMLARLFPDAQIISVELERDTPHDRVARERLSAFKNVDMRYGDSLKLLPALVQDDDVVVIDGPKGPLGIELCLLVSREASPAMTFLHDTHHGQKERQFLEVFWHKASYSDHPQYVQAFRHLDEPIWKHISSQGIEGWEAPATRLGEPQQSYGPTLACLPPIKQRDAKWCLGELKRLARHFPYWRRD